MYSTKQINPATINTKENNKENTIMMTTKENTKEYTKMTILEMYAQFMTAAELAEMFNMDISLVENQLRKQNIDLTNSKPAYLPFFTDKEEYDRFLEMVDDMADNGKLPLTLEYDNYKSVSSDEINRFIRRFMYDSALHVEFAFSGCEKSGKLYCYMYVDYDCDE